MKYENIKSLVLTILVLTSLILTWNLWTYQPDFDYLDKRDSTISEVAINEKQEIGQLIQPSKLLYHFDGVHHGTEELGDLNLFMEELRRWSLFDIQVATSYSEEDFFSFMHGSGKMEVVFPTTIPLQTFRYITGFSDNEIPPSISINRILIDFSGETVGSEPIIYLVHYDDQKVYQARVRNLSTNELSRTFYQTAKILPTFIYEEVDKNQYVFFPEQSPKVRTGYYYAKQLNPEDFKNALFSNPSIVTRDQVTDGIVYRDDSSLMSVSRPSNNLHYVNPGNTGLGNSLDFNVIERGIEFVNEHSGWTGQPERFKLDNWTSSTIEHNVVYRMFIGDYPIYYFAEKGVADISQSWRNNEIYEYVRPVFEFLSWKSIATNIPSGRDVKRELDNFNDLRNIQDIRVGYELRRESDVYIIEPIWVYKENNAWNKLNFTASDDLEGGI
ncbi:two-component system activity regulator YycH [Bacillus sp. RO1]|uniref:YycH family regulatory protein n=1 Tax=Bacillus sp. RO1 TaxID=2722703 RepID=UPI0014572394|nr:two-component system activity regulator YycH [Bacillus sp. RO1]NLP50389.1 hypothetical protein [Bacillus sp. RO1]